MDQDGRTTARQGYGEWLSLVEHLVRDQGVGGSNPLSPTIFEQSCLPNFTSIPAEPAFPQATQLCRVRDCA